MKRVDRCAQVLADSEFFRIKSDAFSNALQAAFTSDMEHHFEADNIRVLFDDASLLVIFIKCSVSARVEIRRVVVPISLGCCQATHNTIAILL